MRTTKQQWVRRAATMSAATIMAVSGAACTDDGGLSEDEFARQVNALCTAEHKKVDALFTDFPEDPSSERIQELIGDFAPIIREYRDDVKRIGAPEGRSADYEEYTERLDDVVASYEAAREDADAAQALFNQDDTSLSKMEADLGLDVCASR